ncbi:MAG TPA: DUF4340 domain-containing protein [Candidatus Udaeobacter sp.]|jgi:hypothetical protein|nr:DUF4340 domain-containing protein [Candidatus Udaeobacter sp.]
MNWRTTLILAVVVLAVFAYLRFFEMKQPSTGEARRQAQNVVNFDRNKIDGVVIQNGDEKIEIRRHDNKWRLETPFKDQADGALVENLLSDLETWPKEGTIPAKDIDADKSKLNEYGLNRPKLKLKLIGSDRRPEILFGKDAALEGRMYVRFENSKETFLAKQSVKKDIDKKAEEFRDKKLTDLTTAQVRRAALKTPAGEMELEKKSDHWDIVKPLRARADDEKVGDLIAQVTTARIQQFVADDHGDLRPYGLAEPRGSITLFSQEGKTDQKIEIADSIKVFGHEDKGQLLQIGSVPEKEKDQVYVRFAPRGAVYTLPKKIEEVLNIKPADLRDYHLIRIDTNVLDRITIDVPGKRKTVLARKDGNWTIASRNNAPAESGAVRRLIETLQNQRVTKFVEDVASNLPKYGLDKPHLQLTFSSFASENTAETKAGEQPFATLAFGKEEGDNVYARLTDEPFVVAVRRGSLDQISADPLQWQELSIFRFKPDEIHRLSITTDKELSLERGENNQWHWLKGSGEIERTNVQSLLNRLSSLHALRWLGATKPQDGFEKPQLTLAFTTSPDNKASHKLIIGAPASDGTWCAHVDGREGTFVISNSDLTSLRLPLVAQPLLTPSPIQSVTP